MSHKRLLSPVSTTQGTGVLEGHLDGLFDGQLRGWAWCEGQPPVFVQVHVGDRLIARARADLPRADLHAAGKGDGLCAFVISLLGDFEPGQTLTVSACQGEQYVVLHGGTMELDSVVCAGAAQRMREREDLAVDVMPIPFVGEPGMVGFLDHVDRNGKVTGWIYRDEEASDAVTLVFLEQGLPVLTVEASEWRTDLAELRQGDGCCGFKADLSSKLGDGHLHELDIRAVDSSQSLLTRPFRVRLSSRSPAIQVTERPDPLPLERTQVPTLRLSVIVVFFNMRREAERTLTSLSQTYQREIDGLEYEVLCVDNGSDPPLQSAWVQSFGPQFKLITPSSPLSSPCNAINHAALQARGKYLAIMIDGAHVLTPGVFHEAMAAFAAEPDATVALRHWFVGGDQRWLSTAGYLRNMEDRLFQRIHWPRDGYQLFRIGAPITESPQSWFDWLNESNCLFLPAARYDAIGGLDEAFSEPGGGFANLDLARRAEASTPDGMICLVGEATFHQYHQGTTTNVDDDAKDARVRAYASKYRRLRGIKFEGIDRNRLRFRGSLRNDDAISGHQRPLLPMTLSVTDAVRRGNMQLHFDEGSQTYLQSVYAECAMHHQTRWMGRDLALAPADLVNLQEIIGQQRPMRIVTTSNDPGLIGFLESMLLLHELHETLIIQVVAQSKVMSAGPKVRHVVGEPCDPSTLDAVVRLMGTEETTLVLFQPDPADDLPIEALDAYAQFVSFRSYLLFIGTVFGQPWLGYSSRWYRTAIRRFVAQHTDFVIERSWDRHIVTACASGYLRRVGGCVTLDTYDPSLDQLETA